MKYNRFSKRKFFPKATKKFYRRNNVASVGVVKRIVSKTLQRQNELKVLDSVVGLNANTSADQTHLNVCQQGDAMNQRNGQRIFIKSVQLSLDVKGASAGVDQTITVALLRLKQNNGASANASTNYGLAYSATSPLALRAISTQSQVEVIRRWVIDLNRVEESGSERIIKFYKKMNLPVYYNATNGGTVADIDKNALVLIARGDEAQGTTSATVVGYARVRFTD